MPLSFLVGHLGGLASACFSGSRRSGDRLPGVRRSGLGEANTGLITVGGLHAGSLDAGSPLWQDHSVFSPFFVAAFVALPPVPRRSDR